MSLTALLSLATDTTANCDPTAFLSRRLAVNEGAARIVIELDLDLSGARSAGPEGATLYMLLDGLPPSSQARLTTDDATFGETPGPIVLEDRAPDFGQVGFVVAGLDDDARIVLEVFPAEAEPGLELTLQADATYFDDECQAWCGSDPQVDLVLARLMGARGGF